jgi:hypothetical protein
MSIDRSLFLSDRQPFPGGKSGTVQMHLAGLSKKNPDLSKRSFTIISKSMQLKNMLDSPGTSMSMGLAIPQLLLFKATEVIE